MMQWATPILLTTWLMASAATAQDDALIVGSKQFTESRLLAEIMAQLIEGRTDIPVERRVNLGGTMVVFSALREGEIDFYAEYTGTAWTAVLAREDRAPGSLQTYLHVADEYRRRYGVTWLQPFGFSNTYAVAVREKVATRLSLTRISDLRGHRGLRAGWSIEFMNRDDGYPGLAAAYGLDLDARGMEHGLAYEALRSDKVDLIDAYSTDAKLLRFKVRILEDDRGFFPPYDCAPVVRTAALERYPVLRDLLDELAFTLPAARMQRLNYEIEEEKRPLAEVARSFLEETGLLQGDIAAVVGEALPQSGQSFAAFMVLRAPVTAKLVGEHMLLTSVAVVLAILFAIPLGILLTRRQAWSGPVLALTGVIQTIPSLALLACMIPVPGLGLGTRSAIVALFLYALLPILRNTVIGIREVDPDVVEAARGMGMTDVELLRLVELPLALPTIMAGIRTATVISIGVATLAAFIGAGGLGEPILTGLQLNSPQLILSGAVPAALLALAVDFLLGLLDRLLAPRV
jgi:osmoprotectant transport system permease protein